MWLEKLKEFKQKSGLTSKQIAEKVGMPEKTVARIFAGETTRPYMDTLYDIVTALGGSLDDLFAEGKARLASDDLIAVQNEATRLTAENAMLTAENAMLKEKVTAITAENDLLRVKLDHKEEIIAIHNYYRTLLCEKHHD